MSVSDGVEPVLSGAGPAAHAQQHGVSEVLVVGPLSDLAPGTARRVDHGGRKIALVRIDDSVYAIGDTCSHADVSLSEGEVICDSRELECWKHGSAFSLETGEPQTLPATQPVPVYDVAVEDGMVVIRFS